MWVIMEHRRGQDSRLFELGYRTIKAARKRVEEQERIVDRMAMFAVDIPEAGGPRYTIVQVLDATPILGQEGGNE